MAHHPNYGTPSVQRTQSAKSNAASSSMPSVSAEEYPADLDEPPDPQQRGFQKNLPMAIRRESLLTRALHTDSESQSDELQSFASQRQTSRSSTCSNFSGRFDFNSDDGVMSAGTRASTPDPHPHPPIFTRPDYFSRKSAIEPRVVCHEKSDKPAHQAAKSPSKSETSEPVVEAELGRKRCISFACGSASQKHATPSMERLPQKKQPETSSRPYFLKFVCSKTSNDSTNSSGGDEREDPAPPKRQCSIKFACPTKVGSTALDKDHRPKSTRHLSPPPPPPARSPSPDTSSSRLHRDSDITLRNSATKGGRKPSITQSTVISRDSDRESLETNEFHEFASEDEKIDEWVKESTCHKSRLTVADTLKKENDIRQIGEEAEQEALDDEEIEGSLSEEEFEDELQSDDEISDAGFQTDDEDGFAASDDESDGDSDYEWWAPRKSSPRHRTSTSIELVHPSSSPRATSDSSVSSLDGAKVSKPGEAFRSRPRRKSQPQPVPARPGTPDLPDSTDFVCGTLDEDRPLEQAYASCIEQRKAAKYKAIPQDFDPTFPTSDPEDGSDDDDMVHHGHDEDSDKDDLMHGSLENIHHEEPRGRKLHVDKISSPCVSPRRLKSPPPPRRFHSPPPTKTMKSPVPTVQKRLHSPPPPRKLHSPPPKRKYVAEVPDAAEIRVSPPTPRRLFGSHSPRRVPSPLPARRLTSPPSSPTRRPSQTELEPMQIPFGTAFLGARPTLTHTTSLPRSPNPFKGRSTSPFIPTSRPQTEQRATEETEDECWETAHEDGKEPAYKRGAIDIVQGLQQRKSRCRQKFWEKFCQHKDKKREHKRTRPPAGKGAQRMRQIGIDCAEYRGKRVLSV